MHMGRIWDSQEFIQLKSSLKFTHRTISREKNKKSSKLNMFFLDSTLLQAYSLTFVLILNLASGKHTKSSSTCVNLELHAFEWYPTWEPRPPLFSPPLNKADI